MLNANSIILDELLGNNLDLLGVYVFPPIENVLSLSTEEGGHERNLLASLPNLGIFARFSFHH